MDDNQVKAPASPGRIQIKDDDDVGHQPPKEYPTHPHKHVTSPVHEAARFILWALFWAGISVELIAYFMYKGEWGDRIASSSTGALASRRTTAKRAARRSAVPRTTPTRRKASSSTPSSRSSRPSRSTRWRCSRPTPSRRSRPRQVTLPGIPRAPPS